MAEDAEEARAISANLTSEEARRSMRDVAETYDKLAAQADRYRGKQV